MDMTAFPKSLEDAESAPPRAGAHTLAWHEIGVRVPQKGGAREKAILQDISGVAYAGELVALMGPSGCGKTTLLHVLAHRPAARGAAIDGRVLLDGAPATAALMRQLACYVEQDDHLLGALTARETLDFAARLALPGLARRERHARVDALLAAFGLAAHAGTLVGTPLRRGLSGGQKRRLGIAAQLITRPRVLFLDEPTSGLDFVASHEAVSYLRAVVRREQIIVIASIHQPAASTFALFDRLVLLSLGRTCYSGPAAGVGAHFAQIGHPLPTRTSPAEFLLELVNADFAHEPAEAEMRLASIHAAWPAHGAPEEELAHAGVTSYSKEDLAEEDLAEVAGTSPLSARLSVPLTLLHRNFIKSYRDVVAYGIRIAMYFGLALMMGTVWLRLNSDESNIQPRINALFFGSAFMSFMAVAYVPAFLEDRAMFVKERANGLYGAGSFILANFVIGVPYLFLISLLFSVLTYWLCNFHAGADRFWTYLLWLFLDLLAAESLVVLVSALCPLFVLALAVTAFANGLWMAVGGFLVSPRVLNVFWRTWARRIDYQAWVFQGMMVNEFAGGVYECAAGCQCMYSTPLVGTCQSAGEGVLSTYGYADESMGKGVGILIAIVVVYRLLGWVALSLRKT